MLVTEEAVCPGKRCQPFLLVGKGFEVPEPAEIIEGIDSTGQDRIDGAGELQPVLG